MRQPSKKFLFFLFCATELIIGAPRDVRGVIAPLDDALHIRVDDKDVNYETVVDWRFRLGVKLSQVFKIIKAHRLMGG